MPDTDAEAVPFAVWDPDNPAELSTPFSKLIEPMHVNLNPGDMLYLPSLWLVGNISYDSPLVAH